MQIFKKSLGSLLLPILLISLFNSCKTQVAIDDTTVFRYNEHANITSLDPAFAKDQRNIWACNLLYNGLVKLDHNLNVIPDLAQSWLVSDDAMTYTFYLKEHLYFHSASGDTAFAKAEQVTSLDFKFSLERLMDPDLASPASWTMQYVEQITAPAPQTLIIKLNQPYPAFLGVLTMKYCSVIPQSTSSEELRSVPRGTGPFYLKRWEENVKMVMRKNPFYHEHDKDGARLPYLEAVAITFKNDKQSEFLEFTQGNLDFINGLDPSYKDELLTTNGKLKERYRSSINLVKAPFLNTEYLGMNLSNPNSLLNNIHLRNAINLGFDRVKMMKYLRNNIGTPATMGFVPDGLPGGGVVKGFSYDLNKARKELQTFKDETGIQQPVINIATGANYLDLCEFIQKELQSVGIAVVIEVMPPSSLRQARKAGQLEIFRSSWIADYPDAENYLALFYSRNYPPSGSNYSYFTDADYDLLYEQSISIKDPETRKKLYVQMDSIIVAKSATIPLYYDQSVRFVSKEVSGFSSNATNLLDLTRVQKK
ncbi:MAG: ABC transporter substrate-binding protein [Nonlabens sp.]